MTSSESPSPSRYEALRQLERIERDEAFVGLVDDEALDDSLDPRDRRLVREYVAGVTRWRRWLDFLLAEFYHGELNQMELRLRLILRIGAYELLLMRTPTHAAVHENVELAKEAVRPGAAGLVNGVLRSIDRQRDELPAPDTGDPAEDLAIRYSHPTWMVRRWLPRYSREATEELLHWNNRRPFYGLRINPQVMSMEQVQKELDELDVAWSASPFLDDFLRVRHLQPILAEGWLDEGRCSVQDESAGLVVRMLDPQPGDTVVDTCAAPGGKTLYMAARMSGNGRIIAVDRHEERLRLVADEARKRGWQDLIQTEGADLRGWAEPSDAPQADRVLVDAPCSGLGVLAKRADLRWQRSPSDIDDLITLQDELLDAAAQLVRPGGVLVYGTCTIEPEENEERVAAFLDRQEDFQVEQPTNGLPESVVDETGFLRTLPQEHGIDGAFGARLRRNESQ